MYDLKNVAIIGEEFTGKTTLLNALLGCTAALQSYGDIHFPTTDTISYLMKDNVWLIDTPGYVSQCGIIPYGVLQTVSKADAIIVLLDQARADEDLLKKLLLQAHTRDIFFVIPFDSVDKDFSSAQRLQQARAQFSSLSDHSDDAFFCIDLFRGLVGAMENDEAAVAASGIASLKAALLSL